MSDPTLDEKIVAVRTAVAPLDAPPGWFMTMRALLANLEATRPAPSPDAERLAEHQYDVERLIKARRLVESAGRGLARDDALAALRLLDAATRRAEALEAEVASERRALDFLAEAQNNIVPSLPLSERWRKLNDEELRAELVRFFRGWGNTQSQLYADIKAREERIANQRKEITRLEAEVGRPREANTRLQQSLGRAQNDYARQCHDLPSAPPAADHTERARETAQQLFLEKGLRVATAQGQTLRFLTVEAVGEALAAAERVGAEKMRGRAKLEAQKWQGLKGRLIAEKIGALPLPGDE